ncbi:formimidoylglutamate deiminase [bacterium]|nr:formimidoylglutamate deiminase [bacterium]
MLAKIYRFNGLLTENGWLCPAFVHTNSQGHISHISDQKPQMGLIDYVDGYAIPGFQNAHSHAFQYAMAGLAEIHSTQQTPDDFWSWRETMYAIALQVNPDQMEAIATMLYSEMLRHGYTSVAEFHYVHHDKNGSKYNKLSEMGESLMRAAENSGIHLTLVPMFYQKGGFGKAPNEGQRRFISANTEEYLQLLEATENAASNYKNTQVAFGFHSLRAVDEQSMLSALQHAGDKPIHIHIAEQLKEVADCLDFYGKRPVEWLLQHAKVNHQWHLVHATHLNEAEVQTLAASGAQVVLCPSTEGNLGDGIFRLREYMAAGGRWSIGTDSHIGIDPKEELRLLDYGQRLTSHKRNTYYNRQMGDAGYFAIKEALLSGRRAMGNYCEAFFGIAEPFDAVVIDAQSPLVAVSSTENLLSTWLYAGDATSLLGTIVNGQWKVQRNRHADFHQIAQDFKKALKQMAIR